MNKGERGGGRRGGEVLPDAGHGFAEGVDALAHHPHDRHRVAHTIRTLLVPRL